MKISYKQLKKHIQLSESPQELDVILTGLGLEVGGIETVESIKGGLRGFVVGEVLEKWQHPNADKLSCTKVAIGKDTTLAIVCGAANVAAGQKVIVATIGTEIFTPEGSFTIKKSKLRGEPSEGMICAEDELGLGKGHEGILVLAPDAIVGTPAAQYFGIESDAVIEIELTPNRADALSHYGVARDLYAYFKSRGEQRVLTLPDCSAFGQEDNPITIEITHPDACMFYTGIVLKGVEVKESPEWLKKTLHSLGIQSINNVVDCTNYVMHELGQPLHAFDLSEIKGNKIIVGKNCTQNFIALDGKELEISSADLMIQNSETAMCIAGVFGGLTSGVKAGTSAIFLESAYFNPIDVRLSSKRHNYKTDASYRFERGVDPAMVEKALWRAAKLIKETAHAQSVSKLNSCGTLPASYFEVDFNPEYCNNILGNSISSSHINTILTALEIKVNTQQIPWKLQVPSYRVDVQRPIDVIEDILRVYGYNNITLPEQFKFSLNSSNGIPPENQRKTIGDFLAVHGFYEILNNSLTKQEYYEKLLPSETLVALLNPLSKDLAVLRQNLIFGGLESIQRNQNMKNPNLRLFEFGKSYAKIEGQEYTEQQCLSLFLTGDYQENAWNASAVKFDFYSLKGIVELVLAKLNLTDLKISTEAIDLMEDSVAVTLKRKKDTIVQFGAIKRSVLTYFDIKNPVYVAQFNWDNILKYTQYANTKYSPLNKFHPIQRELSLLLDKDISYDELVLSAKACERSLLKKISLFDVYEGDKLPPGKKSYTLSFLLAKEEETLKDHEIEKIMQKLQNNFETKFKAILR